MTAKIRHHEIFAPRRWLTACGGFVVYGGWGFWVNLGEGSQQALGAMLTQGSISFVLTFLLNIYIEWLYAKLKHQPGYHLKSWGIASLSVIGASATINLLTGTPEVILTILPGSLVGLAYIWIYLMSLKTVNGTADSA